MSPRRGLVDIIYGFPDLSLLLCHRILQATCFASFMFNIGP